MIKKVVGILIVGLLIATMLPGGTAQNQPIDEKTNITKISKLTSSIEIKIRGGWGIHATIKNIGTTDLNDVNINLVLDGRLVFPGYRGNVGTMDFEAGKTHWVIFPICGFGATNIELTVDTTTETASGKIMGFFVFGVK